MSKIKTFTIVVCKSTIEMTPKIVLTNRKNNGWSDEYINSIENVTFEAGTEYLVAGSDGIIVDVEPLIKIKDDDNYRTDHKACTFVLKPELYDTPGFHEHFDIVKELGHYDIAKYQTTGKYVETYRGLMGHSDGYYDTDKKKDGTLHYPDKKDNWYVQSVNLRLHFDGQNWGYKFKHKFCTASIGKVTQTNDVIACEIDFGHYDRCEKRDKLGRKPLTDRYKLSKNLEELKIRYSQNKNENDFGKISDLPIPKTLKKLELVNCEIDELPVTNHMLTLDLNNCSFKKLDLTNVAELNTSRRLKFEECVNPHFTETIIVDVRTNVKNSYTVINLRPDIWHVVGSERNIDTAELKLFLKMYGLTKIAKAFDIDLSNTVYDLTKYRNWMSDKRNVYKSLYFRQENDDKNSTPIFKMFGKQILLVDDISFDWLQGRNDMELVLTEKGKVIIQQEYQSDSYTYESHNDSIMSRLLKLSEDKSFLPAFWTKYMKLCNTTKSKWIGDIDHKDFHWSMLVPKEGFEPVALHYTKTEKQSGWKLYMAGDVNKSSSYAQIGRETIVRNWKEWDIVISDINWGKQPFKLTEPDKEVMIINWECMSSTLLLQKYHDKIPFDAIPSIYPEWGNAEYQFDVNIDNLKSMGFHIYEDKLFQDCKYYSDYDSKSQGWYRMGQEHTLVDKTLAEEIAKVCNFKLNLQGMLSHGSQYPFIERVSWDYYNCKEKHSNWMHTLYMLSVPDRHSSRSDKTLAPINVFSDCFLKPSMTSNQLNSSLHKLIKIDKHIIYQVYDDNYELKINENDELVVTEIKTSVITNLLDITKGRFQVVDMILTSSQQKKFEELRNLVSKYSTDQEIGIERPFKTGLMMYNPVALVELSRLDYANKDGANYYRFQFVWDSSRRDVAKQKAESIKAKILKYTGFSNEVVKQSVKHAIALPPVTQCKTLHVKHLFENRHSCSR